MIRIDEVALIRMISDPRGYYHSPEDVLLDYRLTRQEKVLVLKRWLLCLDEEQAMIEDLESASLCEVLVVLDTLMNTR